MFVVYLKE